MKIIELVGFYCNHDVDADPREVEFKLKCSAREHYGKDYERVKKFFTVQRRKLTTTVLLSSVKYCTLDEGEA